MKYLMIYIVFCFLLWVVFEMCYLRFFIPAIPVLSIVMGYFLVNYSEVSFMKKIITTVAGVMFLSNIYYGAGNMKISLNPYGILTGLQSKSEYLSQARSTYPSPSYPVFEWINNNTAAAAKVLVIGEYRGYYLKRAYIGSTIFDRMPVIEYTRQAKSGDELYERFGKEGITHIMVNMAEVIRLWERNVFDWTDEERRPFDEFWNRYIKQAYRWNWAVVYELMPRGVAVRPHEVPVNYVANFPAIAKKYGK